MCFTKAVIFCLLEMRLRLFLFLFKPFFVIFFVSDLRFKDMSLKPVERILCIRSEVHRLAYEMRS